MLTSGISDRHDAEPGPFVFSHLASDITTRHPEKPGHVVTAKMPDDYITNTDFLLL
jgi:hypothetical protein